MAILNINKGGNAFHKSGVGDSFVNRLKTALASDNSYSTESESNLAALRSGAADKIDLGAFATKLANAVSDGEEVSLESAMDQNAAGIGLGSLLWSVGNSAGDYLKMLSKESMKAADGAGIASSYASEFADIYSTESFDNQTLNDFMPVSIALAYTTGRQSPGMEAVYRTIALTPDQGGVDIEVPLLFTANTLAHANDGSASDFGFRRVSDSSIDHRILKDDTTKVIPTHNVTTAANFMPTASVTPWDKADGRRNVTTSAMLIGKDINLLGIGQLDAVSRAGQADYTEALDRNIGLDQVFATLGNDTIAFNVKGVPYSRFVKSVEQGGKKLTLNLPLSALQVDKNSVAYDGEALEGAIFETIADGGYKVRLKVTLTGNVDVERGVISVNAGVVSVASIVDELGQLVSLTDAGGVGPSIVTGLAGLKIEGWTVDANLTNSNHRHLGLMLNVRTVKERLLTRVRSPIYVPFPVTEDRDQTVLDWLTFATQQQKDADGLTQLIEYHARLMDQTGGIRGDLTPGDFEENALAIEGVGRHLVNAYIQTLRVKLENTQSLDTDSNINNAQTTLLNTLRSVYFDIMQKTNYENVARYMDGGQITKKFYPVFITSETVHRFMTVQGDTRTLGADVPFQTFPYVDQRLRTTEIDAETSEEIDVDSMYMVLVREGDGVDPLTAGVMLNTPSLVATLQVSRGGRVNKEIVTQPRYAHYNLCPIVVKIEIEGVHDLLRETLPFKNCDVCAPEPVEPVEPVDPVDP